MNSAKRTAMPFERRELCSAPARSATWRVTQSDSAAESALQKKRFRNCARNGRGFRFTFKVKLFTPNCSLKTVHLKLFTKKPVLFIALRRVFTYSDSSALGLACDLLLVPSGRRLSLPKPLARTLARRSCLTGTVARSVFSLYRRSRPADHIVLAICLTA